MKQDGTYLTFARNDFIVYENGEPQQIFFFYASMKPSDGEEPTDAATFSTVSTVTLLSQS